MCNMFCVRAILTDTKITIHHLIHCITTVIHFAIDINLSFFFLSFSSLDNFTLLLE